MRAGRVGEDLTFEFHTLPGLRMVVASQSRVGDVSVRVHLQGRDLTETGVEFREGRDISGLEVEISAVPLPASPLPPVNRAPTTPIGVAPPTPAVR